MRNHVLCVAAVALLAGACSAPTETSNVVGVPPLAVTRAGRPIVPRAIRPAKTPLGLDNTPVKVMVEVAGEPITVVQAQTPERKLTRDERQQIRESVRGQQAPVRSQIEALGGRVLREYQSAYNGLAVHIARRQVASLAKIPGVAGVHPLRVMKPTTTLAVPFVGAPTVWHGGVAGLRGEGLKVAILDTGIDYTHANFGGPGTSAAYEAAHAAETQPPDPAMIGPNAPRIKGGVDLVGDAYDASSTDPLRTVPHPDLNPLDCEGHGSHVAGIAAGSGVTSQGLTYTGVYDANTYANAFRIGPGVAPKADLYAVRVFGCEGSTDVTVDAIEWSVDNDMDVINMSLGSTFGGADDPSAVAAANAVRAGVVVVASAGNDGTNYYMTGTPASGDGVISVAATDVAPTFPGANLTFEGGSIQALNSNGASFADGTSYPRVVVLGTPGAVGLGCTAAEYARPDVPGALVVTMRGTCARVDRATFGQAAGAAAVAMINTDEGFPPFDGQIAGVTIPFFGIRSIDTATLTAQTSLTASNVVLENPGYREPASFTSGGPRLGDSALKPNLIAPGVGVVSTNIGTGNGALTLSGTSMSGPVVAGLATLTRQAHSNWRAIDVANALTNTADPGAMRTYSTRVSGVGVPQAPNATRTGAVASSGGSSAVSFGFIELGRNQTERRDIVVRNYETFAMTFNVSLPANYKQGVTHDVSVPTQIRVPGRSTARLPISVSVSPDAAVPLDFNEIAGIVELTPATSRTNRGVALRIPYYAVVRPHSRLDGSVDAPRRRNPTGTATITNRRGAISGSAELYAWSIEGTQDDIGCNDVRAVGVQSFPFDVDDRLILFAINGFRRCSNHSVNEYDLIVTAASGAQYGVIGIDEGYAVSGAFNGTLATLVLNLSTGEGWINPADAFTDTSTIFLVALGSQMGVTSAAPRFSYFSQTFNLAGEGDDPPSAVASYNAYTSSVIGQGLGTIVDPNGVARLAIGADPTEWLQTPAKGLMIVFPQNSPGAAQAGLFPFPAFSP